MTADQFHAILEKGAVLDLSAALRLRFTGADRIRYLNGQVTNDVTTATADRVLPACVTNHKGRLEAIVHLHAAGDAIFLDAPASLRDTLPPRLEKYIIADDVSVDDLSDSTGLLHFCGVDPQRLTGHLGPDERLVAHARLGPPGWDLWCPAARLPAWLALADVLAPADADVIRVLHGIPDWDADLSHGILPPEARLEATRISYSKGCYIGQEVISRMRSAGKVNRLLRPVSLRDADAPARGAILALPDGSEAGTLSSVAADPVRGGHRALAWLRRDAGDGPWSCAGGSAVPADSAS